MLETLKTNKASAFLFNVVLAVILIVPLAFNLQEADNQDASGSNLLYFNSIIPLWVQSVASILLYLITIWFANFVVTKHQLMGRGNQLTGFFCLILLALGPNLLFNNLIPLSSLLVIRLFDRCFELQKSTKPNPLLFDGSFLVTILTLLYTPFILLIILVWLAGLYSGHFSFKGWLLSIFTVFIGFYLFIGTLYLMSLTIIPSLEFQISNLFFPSSEVSLITLICITLLILITLPTTFSVLRFSKVIVRNHLNIVLWSIPILFLVFITTHLKLEFYFSFLFFPLAIILGQFFLKTKKQRLAKWGIIVLIILVATHRFIQLI